MKKYGQDSKYRILHLWVEKMLGKPKRCDLCGDTTERRYHWANISGEYKREVTDWRRLCVSCHNREKHPGLCNRGHSLTFENTYIYPQSSPNYGCVECRTCRAQRR